MKAESRGMSFWDGLQLMFIGLKITGQIDWNWWLVFLPMLIGLGLGIVIGIAKGLTSGRKE